MVLIEIGNMANRETLELIKWKGIILINGKIILS